MYAWWNCFRRILLRWIGGLFGITYSGGFIQNSTGWMIFVVFLFFLLLIGISFVYKFENGVSGVVTWMEKNKKHGASILLITVIVSYVITILLFPIVLILGFIKRIGLGNGGKNKFLLIPLTTFIFILLTSLHFIPFIVLKVKQPQINDLTFNLISVDENYEDTEYSNMNHYFIFSNNLGCSGVNLEKVTIKVIINNHTYYLVKKGFGLFATNQFTLNDEQGYYRKKINYNDIDSIEFHIAKLKVDEDAK